MTGEIVEVADLPERGWGRFLRALLRSLICLGFLMMFPFLGLMQKRARRKPSHRLENHANEVWARSPEEAGALVKGVFDQLREARASGAKDWHLELPPYGRFDELEFGSVAYLVYRQYLALGWHQPALNALQLLPVFPGLILLQVDCLVALDRKGEAIALLDQHLSIDDRRGRLRRRLIELGGHLRSV